MQHRDGQTKKNLNGQSFLGYINGQSLIEINVFSTNKIMYRNSMK